MMATASSSRRLSDTNNYDSIELDVPEVEMLMQTRSSKVYTPSPLNPSPSPTPSGTGSVTRTPTSSSATDPTGLKPASPSPPPRFARASSSHSNLVGSRKPSEDSRILTSPGGRGSMILYHVPGDEAYTLSPPPTTRPIMLSTISRDSTISYSDDSKYPGLPNEHGVQPYVFDPELDGGTFDKEDLEALSVDRRRLSVRGLINVVALVVILGGLIGLFVVYPATRLSEGSARQTRVMNNRYINGTGQAVGF